MIRLINFSDDRMTRSQMVCTISAQQKGVDQVLQYNPHHISKEFYQLNKTVLDAERGAGYWLWKPYFINKGFDFCKDGDILIYMDSGVKLINDVKNIIDVMDQDIFLFSNGHMHVHWCKADVMKAMFATSLPVTEYYNFQQVQASVIFFKVNDFSRKFIKEWLLWCQMPNFINDEPSVLPNHPEFAEHRHDQAILTCLQIKYNLKLHWWADKLWYESQRGRWPNDKYPSMWEHHRKRNNEY